VVNFCLMAERLENYVTRSKVVENFNNIDVKFIECDDSIHDTLKRII